MSNDSSAPNAIEAVFGSKAYVQVLSYLASHPDETYFQTELAEEIGVSQAMVSRVSSRLRETGVVVHARDEETGRRSLTMNEGIVSDILSDLAHTPAPGLDDE